MVSFVSPAMDEEMIRAAGYAFQNERMTNGESCSKFEEEFAKFIGAKHAVAVNNGTNALMFTQMGLGLQYDGVATTPMSFIATANSILHANNCPVFIDIKPNLHMNLGGVDTKDFWLAKRAIMPVSLYGHRTNLDEIKVICDDFGKFMIEDNAQWHCKGSGVVGNAACYSFYTTKNMTVGGDGGMVVTDDAELAERVRNISNCGRTSHDSFGAVGYSGRLSTALAAIGRVQLKHLDEWNHLRAHFARIYCENLRGVGDIELMEATDKSTWHLFTIRTPRRDELKEYLKNEGIPTMIHYPKPIHLQDVYVEKYSYTAGTFPTAEMNAKQTLSLPMHPFLKHEEVILVCEKIKEFFQ